MGRPSWFRIVICWWLRKLNQFNLQNYRIHFIAKLKANTASFQNVSSQILVCNSIYIDNWGNGLPQFYIFEQIIYYNLYQREHTLPWNSYKNYSVCTQVKAVENFVCQVLTLFHLVCLKTIILHWSFSLKWIDVLLLRFCTLSRSAFTEDCRCEWRCICQKAVCNSVHALVTQPNKNPF